MDLDKILNVAREAALAGGAVLQRGFNLHKEVQFKGFADPVTQFDKESEQVIVDIIQKYFPAHSILTEEELSSDQGGDYKWIIDPLDGTVNFTHRIPYICVSIGVEFKGEIVAGVIYNPILDEYYHAAQGQGAWLNGESIHVSQQGDIGKSLLATGFPYHRDGRLEHLLTPFKKVVIEYQGFRRLGSAAMDMAYVACGKCEGFYEEGLQPWDTAAGVILIQEAGGVVTDYFGKKFSAYQKTIIASNGMIQDSLIDICHSVVAPQ